MRPAPWPVEVPAAVLEDLDRRLRQTRWPDALAPGWDYGTDLSYLRELVTYWLDDFDWREQEALLDRLLPGYRTRVSDLDVHFAHVPGQGPDPFPLLLVHGWPGSYFEMHKIVGPLADPARHGGDPADAFDVVVPSLPGHGFSQAPTRAGFGADQCADLLRDLMVDVLGYARFGSQGGDRGAFVSAGLGHRHPDHVVGIHLNMAAGIAAPSGERTPEEEQWLADRAAWQQNEAGYSAIQSTKPQSLAYGLMDSPAGLAAWIVEKWCSWSDCHGDIESRFSKDELLTNVMLYWVTGSIRSSMQMYHAHRTEPPVGMRAERIEVPTAVASFPAEIAPPPRSAVERKYNLVRWTEMQRGGHFAAMEEPAALVEDIRCFFRGVRKGSHA